MSNNMDIFFSDRMQQMLAREVVLSAVDAAVDMSSDYEERLRTFGDVDQYLLDIKDVAIDIVSNHLDDLRERIEYYIQKSDVNLKTVEFDESGLVSVNVDVVIEDE